MKISVNFKSGYRQSFIVPKTMLATDFRDLAEGIGGRIENIEFSLTDKHDGLCDVELQEPLLSPECNAIHIPLNNGCIQYRDKDAISRLNL